jgi:hypothetical protein
MERNEVRKARDDVLAKRLIDSVDRAAGIAVTAAPSTGSSVNPPPPKPKKQPSIEGPPKVRTYTPGQDDDDVDDQQALQEQETPIVYAAMPGEWETVEEEPLPATSAMDMPKDDFTFTIDDAPSAKKRLLDLAETLEEEGDEEGGYPGRGGANNGFQLVEKTLDSALDDNAGSLEPSSTSVAFKKRKIKGSLRKK